MTLGPWDKWIPGVLSAAQVLELREGGFLQGVDDGFDASSFDLTLSGEAYVLTQGSVKPGRSNYVFTLVREGLVERLTPASDGTFTLSAKKTYLFKLSQRFPLYQRIADAGIHGQATAKSSIGRLDVLARLIMDGMHGYEGFNPDALRQGTGDMYLEVTPLTFSIRVRQGVSLSQLRLFYGKPEDAQMGGEALWRTVFRQVASPDGALTLDLSPVEIGGLKVVAFSSRRDVSEPIHVWIDKDRSKPDPCRYWKVHQARENRRLPITPGAFYILRSKEHMWVPEGVAVYCRASDETIGEMRIHYAGFVHPYFGSSRLDGGEGTPLIFEVRGHDFAVSLEDGEQMARLTFYRMSQPAGLVPDPAYTNQDLALSKFFDDWPAKLSYNDDCTVAPA